MKISKLRRARSSSGSEAVGDAHVGLAQRQRPAREALAEGRRRRDLDVVERVGEARRRLPAAVRRLELKQQRERPVARALAHEAQRVLADHVVGVPGLPRHRAVHEHRRIEVLALPGQHRGVVVAFRRRVDVPLADHAGVVAVGAQQVRPGPRVAQLRFAGETGFLAVGAQTVRMRVLPGEEAGAARQAQRVGDEPEIETQAFVADAVQVRRLQYLAAVHAERRLRVVVGHDEDDVRPPRPRAAHHRRRAAAEQCRKRHRGRARRQSLQCAAAVEPCGHGVLSDDGWRTPCRRAR
jgi:hypothetical protein